MRKRQTDCTDGDDEQPCAKAWDVACVPSAKRVTVRGTPAESKMHVSHIAMYAATADGSEAFIAWTKEFVESSKARLENVW